MNLDESIKQALNDSDVKNAIKEQIDQVTEAKARGRAQSLINEKIEELNSDCEEFKDKIESEYNEKLNKKIDKLSEHCETYKSQLCEELEKKYNARVKRFERKLAESVSKYVDGVVNDFINDHRQAFTVHENELKTNAILEALSAVCAVAGVRAEQITEGASYLSNKDVAIQQQRVDNLKVKLREAEKSHTDAQNELEADLDNEKKKTSKLEEALRQIIKEGKAKESEAKDLRNEINSRDDDIKALKESINKLKAERNTLTESIRSLQKTNDELNGENTKILKMGVISEMKQGMTLTEARKFEQIAEQIPFEQSKQYFDKLEILKNELMNTDYKKLNEVTDRADYKDQEPDEDSEEEAYEDNAEFEGSRWEHLI